MRSRAFIVCIFLMTMSCCSMAQEYLIINPDFENWSDGTLLDWVVSSAEPNAVKQTSESYSGEYAVKMSHQYNSSYSSVRQAIDVKPNTLYEASVMVRGENIKVATGGKGFRIFIGKYPVSNQLATSNPIDGTFDWVRLYSRFNTGNESKIWLYVYLHRASGDLWFDDILLTEVDKDSEEQRVLLRQKTRLMADLQQVKNNLEVLEQKQGVGATVGLRQELSAIEIAVNRHSFVDVFDYTKSPPYNDLHRTIYVINGKVFAKLYNEEEFIVWSEDKWDLLSQLQLPNDTMKICLQEDIMLNEWGNVAFNITNTTASQQTFTISLEEFKDGDNTFPLDRINLREVVFVESITYQMQPDALPLIRKNQNGLHQLIIPPGATAQVWLQINGKAFQRAGSYDGIINLSNGKQAEKVYLTVKFWPLFFPEQVTLHGYNWAYLYSPILVGKEREAVEDLLAHYINTIIIPYQYLPWPTVDNEGNIISMDFSKFDRQLEYHCGASMFLFFFGFNNPANQQKLTSLEFLSSQWEKVFGQWINAIVSHLEARGIGKNQFAFYPVDEPAFAPNERHEIWVSIARKIKAIDRELLVYANPVGDYHTEGLSEIAEFADIICPQLKSFTPEVSQELQSTGRTIWTYQCDGPGKNLSPIGYYRLQPWGAWLNNATGSGFWAYGSLGSSMGGIFDQSAWDDFDGAGADYAVVYEDQVELVPSKRWEAWREGFEDYEYLVMIEKELKRLENCIDPNVKRAHDFLKEMPQRVFDSGDPLLIQDARLIILELLSKLKKIN